MEPQCPTQELLAEMHPLSSVDQASGKNAPMAHHNQAQSALYKKAGLLACIFLDEATRTSKFGSAGVKMTTGLGLEFIIRVCQQGGQHVPSASSLLQEHSMHVRMLFQLLAKETHFSRCARVLGRKDLDPLSKSCTLQALSSSRVSPFLTLHDFRRRLLEQAYSHVNVLKFLTHKRTFPFGVVALIDAFGCFTVTLAARQTIVTKADVALAMLVERVARHIKQYPKHKKRNTPVLVATGESLLHQGAQREVCKEARPLTNILNREAHTASNDPFYLIMARPVVPARSAWLRPWQFRPRPPAEPLQLAYESRFFRYMRRVGREVNKNLDIHEWVETTRCNLSDKRHHLDALTFRALTFRDSMLTEFIPAVREWHARVFGGTGTLISLMTCPIMKPETTEVFSAVVYGTGRGRMELLCFELISEACHMLERHRWNPQCPYWKALDEKFKLSSRASVGFRVAITTHEVWLQSPPPGRRSDFLLLAYTSIDANPLVLGYACHTPDVLRKTSSNTATQAYSKTRVTWRTHVPLPGLMEAAATSLAETLLLPTPRNESQIEDILAKQMWMQTVLQQAVDPIDASIDTETHTFASTFTRTKASVDSDDTSDEDYVW